MITSAELKTSLPLPELMARCGDKDRAKKSARCPFHVDSEPSFSVFQRDELWFWKCHAGCGQGDELDYLKKKFGLSDADAFAKWREHVGSSGTKLPASSAPNLKTEHKSDQDLLENWRQCVTAFTEDHAVKLAQWRGYSPGFVAWQRERELVGLYKGGIAFPVHGAGGKVIAIHYRIPPKREGERARWVYCPEGVGVRLLVIGDMAWAEYVAVFESQWDLLAVADKLGVHGNGGVSGWASSWQRAARPTPSWLLVLCRKRRQSTPSHKTTDPACSGCMRSLKARASR